MIHDDWRETLLFGCTSLWNPFFQEVQMLPAPTNYCLPPAHEDLSIPRFFCLAGWTFQFEGLFFLSCHLLLHFIDVVVLLGDHGNFSWYSGIHMHPQGVGAKYKSMLLCRWSRKSILNLNWAKRWDRNDLNESLYKCRIQMNGNPKLVWKSGKWNSSAVGIRQLFLWSPQNEEPWMLALLVRTNYKYSCNFEECPEDQPTGDVNCKSKKVAMGVVGIRTEIAVHRVWSYPNATTLWGFPLPMKMLFTLVGSFLEIERCVVSLNSIFSPAMQKFCHCCIAGLGSCKSDPL